jgi:hypothetical protein
VYCHFDERGLLLYVGVTANLAQRWRNHAGVWKRHVSRTEVEWFPTRRDALAAESDLIRTQVPLFNGEHNMNSRPPLAALYQVLVAALPARPSLDEVRRTYPTSISDGRAWETIEARRGQVLHAFGALDSGTPAVRPRWQPIELGRGHDSFAKWRG